MPEIEDDLLTISETASMYSKSLNQEQGGSSGNPGAQQQSSVANAFMMQCKQTNSNDVQKLADDIAAAE